MVAESRQALFMGTDEAKNQIYLKYYSMTRLRKLSEYQIKSREENEDHWQGLQVTFKLFDEQWRGRLLELSPLNGDLFGSNVLDILDKYSLDNTDFLKGMRHLSLYPEVLKLNKSSKKEP